MALTAPLAVIL
jgi:hypothetical protein